VAALNDEAILAFHRSADAKLLLAYYPLVLSQAGSIGPALLLAMGPGFCAELLLLR
jgi:predicted naringenin-chalcone synthase